MVNKHSRVAAILAAMLVVLPACSSSNGGTPNTPAATPGVNAPSNVDTTLEPVEITVWDQPKADDIERPWKEQVFADFEAKYPHITVNHEQAPVGTSDRQVFVTAMAGGQGPDAYQSAYFPIIGDWVKQELALDLTPYWSEWADKDQFIASSMAQATIDDKVYGVPNNMYVMGLLFNKALFEEAGLDTENPPADWDAFVEAGKALSKPENQQYGYSLLGMDWADWFFEYYVWQAGGDLTTKLEDGTVQLDFTKEPTVTALQFYKDLKWTHQITQQNVLQDFDDNQNDFFQSRAAMILYPSDGFGKLMEKGSDINQIGYSPMPAGPAGVSPSQTGGAYWIINPKADQAKQDAAWTYISYMTSKEVMESEMQFMMDNGIVPNLLSVRSDINPADYAEGVPQNLVDGVAQAAENTQLEYYLKERLSPYIVKAIQKVLTDQNADPLAALEEAEKVAQTEVADPYNLEITQ